MDPARTPDNGEIARRAYALWEKEGRPEGRDRDHWKRAEIELGSQQAAAESEPAAAKKPARPRKAAAANAEPAPSVTKPARRRTTKTA